jgi:3-dehydrotetronate 4-kinase
MTIKLGCIADDFTGATDLANNLVRAGMRAVQTNGVPSAPLAADVDAVVVALKSRTTAPAEAIAQSLQALMWLKNAGATQIYFKYCSTFDSWYGGDGTDKRWRRPLFRTMGARFSKGICLSAMCCCPSPA